MTNISSGADSTKSFSSNLDLIGENIADCVAVIDCMFLAAQESFKIQDEQHFRCLNLVSKVLHGTAQVHDTLIQQHSVLQRARVE